MHRFSNCIIRGAQSSMGTFQEDVPNQYRIHVGNIYQAISIFPLECGHFLPTLRYTNIAMGNGPLEDVSPTYNGDFPLPY